jgi:hypothetical protein
MDERTEGADILTFLTVLDGVHRDLDRAPDALAEACCPGDYDFHYSFVSRSVPTRRLRMSHHRFPIPVFGRQVFRRGKRILRAGEKIKGLARA